MFFIKFLIKYIEVFIQNNDQRHRMEIKHAKLMTPLAILIQMESILYLTDMLNNQENIAVTMANALIRNLGMKIMEII